MIMLLTEIFRWSFIEVRQETAFSYALRSVMDADLTL